MPRPSRYARYTLAALALCLTAASCGERSKTTDDAAVQRDGKAGDPDLDANVDLAGHDVDPLDGLPDGPGQDAPASDGPPPKCGPFKGVIGKVCVSAASCGSGYSCGKFYGGSAGLCTKSCIPDDPQTPIVDEDTCPTGSICANAYRLTGVSQYLCFQKCTPQLGCSECDSGLACHPSAGRYVNLYHATVCLFTQCASDADCKVTTGQACQTTAASCPAGQTCQPKITGATDGLCTKAGKCDTLSGLCDKHGQGTATAKVGDPCKGDVDCGDAMYCLYEVDESQYLKQGGASCTGDSECCSGTCLSGTCAQGPCKVRYRNGYCTILGCQYASTLPIRACPAGSDCNILYGGGVCQKSCDMTKASECRNHGADLLGDYDCRAWNNITASAKAGKATQGPVCDFGFSVPCKTWFSAKSDCSVLGNTGNTTKMACRDLKNSILSNKYDPDGFCLDDTASGKVP